MKNTGLLAALFVVAKATVERLSCLHGDSVLVVGQIVVKLLTNVTKYVMPPRDELLSRGFQFEDYRVLANWVAASILFPEGRLASLTYAHKDI